MAVLADGAWSKRSYYTNYDASSGVVISVVIGTSLLLINSFLGLYQSSKHIENFVSGWKEHILCGLCLCKISCYLGTQLLYKLNKNLHRYGS